jgi:hypothetical protein
VTRQHIKGDFNVTSQRDLKIAFDLAEADTNRSEMVGFATYDSELSYSVKLIEQGGREYLTPDRWSGDVEMFPNLLGPGAKEPWEPVRLSRRDRRGMLLRFSRLADKKSGQIEKFADRYGFLGICNAHGLPSHHKVGQSCDTGDDEAVDHWRTLSDWVATVLRVSADLLRHAKNSNDGGIGRDKDWRTIFQLYDEDIATPSTFHDAKHELVGAVNFALEIAYLRPQLDWSQPNPRWAINGRWRWADIALQLAAQIIGGSLANCFECGQPYRTTRTPQAGRLNYCEECRDGPYPARNRKQAQRTRESKIANA